MSYFHCPGRAPRVVPTPRVSGLAAGLILAAVSLAGCSSPTQAEDRRPSAAQAVAFTEDFYRSVLSGEPGVCEVFTDQGRADFVTDMNPATTCEEAADVLGNAVGEAHVEEFTAFHEFSVEEETADAVVVRADFATYADLVSVEWIQGAWRVGVTERVASTQPTPTAPPHGDDHGHHGHDEGHDEGHDGGHDGHGH